MAFQGAFQGHREEQVWSRRRPWKAPWKAIVLLLFDRNPARQRGRTWMKRQHYVPALTRWIAMGIPTALCSAVAVLLAGCDTGPGYPSARVAGQITLDDEPIADGKISFRPVNRGAGPTVGTEFVDGAYVLEHVPLGTISVQLIATVETDKMVPLWPNDPQGPQVRKIKDLIPEKYKRGIEIEVEGDNESLNFELVSE